MARIEEYAKLAHMTSPASPQKGSTGEQAFEYQSVEVLKGVGPSVAAKLEKLGIFRVQDLLFHLPLRYEDRTRVVPIGSLRHGQHAVIEGAIEHAEVRYGGRQRSGRSLLCHLSDGTGSVQLRFFYFNAAQQANLVKGVRLRCYGEARYGYHQVEMVHPEYRRVLDQQTTVVEEAMTPVYAKTEGVHQALLRNLVDQALQRLGEERLQEYVPSSLSKQHRFPDLQHAIQLLHHPPPETSLALLEQCKHPAQQRMIFEELLAHQLSLIKLRQRVQKKQAERLLLSAKQREEFERTLEFDLTAAQQKVIDEILDDLAKPTPMMRLLQGDVGSGKTVVSACAVLASVASGKQAAVMAPTEILAEQLYSNFCNWFSAKHCVLLTGKDKGRLREGKLGAIANAEVSIVVGTHA